MKDVYEWFEENGAPPGITIEFDEEKDTFSIVVAADADKKEREKIDKMNIIILFFVVVCQQCVF